MAKAKKKPKRRKFRQYVVTLKQDVTRTAEAIIDARSPKEAIVIAEGIADTMIWRNEITASWPSKASIRRLD